MKKFFKQVKLFYTMKFGKPYKFDFVSSEGKPIGPVLEVCHLTLHDMAEWACRCRLTEEVILNNIGANSISVAGFKRLDRYNGITTFQPCKV